MLCICHVEQSETISLEMFHFVRKFLFIWEWLTNWGYLGLFIGTLLFN